MIGRRSQCGVSLVELVIVIIIVAVAASGIALLINETAKRSADPQMIQQAQALARSYLEEALLRPFCDPQFLAPAVTCPMACTANACGNCGGTAVPPIGSRDQFDDVCDYDGLSDVGAVDQTGAPLTGLGNFNVNMNVNDSVTLNGLSGAAGQVVIVNVTVTHNANQRVNVNLSGYRSNF